MNWNYINGFFDADGSICLTKNHSMGQKTIQLSFHNNDLNILECIRIFIKNELGINGTISIKLPKKANHNIAYDLSYLQQKAYKICDNLSCVHLLKKHKIATCLKYYNKVTPRNGKYNKQLLIKHQAFERLFYWKCSQFYN